MILRIIKLNLLLSVLLTFFSCKGQDKSINKGDELPLFKMDEITNFEKGEIVEELDDRIWGVFQDSKGNYWFGSNGDGIVHYDGKVLTQYNHKDGLIDNTIRGIQEDKLGNIFIGTPHGVSKYDGNTFTTLKLISNSENEPNEWKLEPDDLWFNCNGRANHVYRYDGKSLFELALPEQNLEEAFGREVRGLSFKDMSSSPYSVFGIDKDRSGNLWIGTATAGAFRYDGETFLWVAESELSTLPDGRVPGVRSMIEDKDGNMWLSNFISRYKINENESNTSYEKLEGNRELLKKHQGQLPYFNSGLTDAHGDLWMTTYSGDVWKYDGAKLLNWEVYDGETEALIISIYEDNNGVMWLGTDNVGVFKFDGEEFVKFQP